MIHIQKLFSKEYLEHSLCSDYYGVHSPLARPYETILYDRRNARRGNPEYQAACLV